MPPLGIRVATRGPEELLGEEAAALFLLLLPLLLPLLLGEVVRSGVVAAGVFGLFGRRVGPNTGGAEETFLQVDEEEGGNAGVATPIFFLLTATADEEMPPPINLKRCHHSPPPALRDSANRFLWLFLRINPPCKLSKRSSTGVGGGGGGGSGRKKGGTKNASSAAAKSNTSSGTWKYKELHRECQRKLAFAHFYQMP